MVRAGSHKAKKKHNNMYALWEYLDTVGDYSDPKAAFSDLRSVIAPLGFDQIVYFILRSPFEQSGRSVFNTYPPEWIEHYRCQGYRHDDLAFLTAATRVAPFRWDKLLANPKITRRQRSVFDGARDFNVKNGVTVPLHGPNNGLATLTFSGDLTESQLDEVWREHKTGLIAAGICSHEAVQRHAGRQRAAGPTKLTNRERECLVWSAQGKTSWKISQILSISQTTVRFHLDNAMKKLGVYSKLHAVVKAILHGLIVP